MQQRAKGLIEITLLTEWSRTATSISQPEEKVWQQMYEVLFKKSQTSYVIPNSHYFWELQLVRDGKSCVSGH